MESPHAVEAPTDFVGYRYWGFISYSHRDTAWVQRFHAKLEGWTVPRKLVGRATPIGLVPKRFYPMYRDRDETSGGGNLDDVILGSLKQSRYLIVICSPNSAKSTYVNEEIRKFKSMGRDSRIIYLIMNGKVTAVDPGNISEFFPLTAQCHVSKDGECGTEKFVPVAIDARPGKDGEKNALLKVLAQLLNIDFADLKRRDLVQERQRRIAGTVIAALLLLVFAFGFIGVADAGLNVPFGEQIRAKIDGEDMSVFRHVQSMSEIKASARILRDKLDSGLRGQLQSNGWINDKPAEELPNVSLMSHAQAMAAIFHRDRLDTTLLGQPIKSLELPYQPRLLLEQDGVKWGWRIVDNPDNPPGDAYSDACIPLWMAIALSEASGNVALNSDPSVRSRLSKDLEYTQEILRLYHNENDPGAWYEYPFQVDPHSHSDYCSTLALMALVEAHRAGVPWDGSADKRDILIKQTAQFLLSTYVATGRQHGWRNTPHEEHASEAYDGLTAQTYCALLLAEDAGVGVSLPPVMLKNIQAYLVSCASRDGNYPVDVSNTQISYRHFDGTTRADENSIRYLWWPWVIRCANLWLRFADRHGLAREERVQARRTLSHLVIDLGTVEAAKTLAGYSYGMSESTYCLEGLVEK